MLDFLDRHRKRPDPDGKELPLILSMTSTGDWATKLALPIGQYLSLPRNSLREYPRQDQFGITNQKSYYLRSTANTAALISHTLQPVTDPTTKSNLICMPIGGSSYCLQPATSRKNETAYWVLEVPKEIIPDHSNIFTDEFLTLLQTLAAYVRPGEPKPVMKMVP
jgi:hypothetical protein